ncbi:mitotic fidelity of chromosome transmission- protein [Dimargaris xerosporica]|nr:mitotic fidelity of chromosome transmission- protein [Dimargaris xerosporica]
MPPKSHKPLRARPHAVPGDIGVRGRKTGLQISSAVTKDADGFDDIDAFFSDVTQAPLLGATLQSAPVKPPNATSTPDGPATTISVTMSPPPTHSPVRISSSQKSPAKAPSSPKPTATPTKSKASTTTGSSRTFAFNRPKTTRKLRPTDELSADASVTPDSIEQLASARLKIDFTEAASARRSPLAHAVPLNPTPRAVFNFSDLNAASPQPNDHASTAAIDAPTPRSQPQQQTTPLSNSIRARRNVSAFMQSARSSIASPIALINPTHQHEAALFSASAQKTNNPFANPCTSPSPASPEVFPMDTTENYHDDNDSGDGGDTILDKGTFHGHEHSSPLQPVASNGDSPYRNNQSPAVLTAKAEHSSQAESTEAQEGEHGIRRSRRMKLKPLAYWKNERVVYTLKHEGQQAVPAVREVIRDEMAESPVEPAPSRPKKSAASRRTASMASSSQAESSSAGAKRQGRKRKPSAQPEVAMAEVDLGHLDEDQGDGASFTEEPAASPDSDEADTLADSKAPEPIVGEVLDYETEEPIHKVIGLSAKMVKLKPVLSAGCYFQKCLQEAEWFSSGVLVINPGREKLMRQTTDAAMIFYIVSGRCSVTVARTTFIMSRGDQFLVPRGNEYRVVNISRHDAKLFFTRATHTFPEPS